MSVSLSRLMNDDDNEGDGEDDDSVFGVAAFLAWLFVGGCCCENDDLLEARDGEYENDEFDDEDEYDMLVWLLLLAVDDLFDPLSDLLIDDDELMVEAAATVVSG